MKLILVNYFKSSTKPVTVYLRVVVIKLGHQILFYVKAWIECNLSYLLQFIA